MPLFSRIASFFAENPRKRAAEIEVPIRYPEFVVRESPLSESLIREGIVYTAAVGTPKWTLLRCPCGCGHVIRLSAQNRDGADWQVSLSGAGRPSIDPPIWRDRGCHSHFRLNDGRVYWYDDSGRPPGR